MVGRMRARLEQEEGFTLLELLIAVQILAILLAVAVPSYLAFKDRASRTASSMDVRTLVDSIAQYAADNYSASKVDPDAATSRTDSGYAGMTVGELRASYDPAIPSTDWVSPADPLLPAGVLVPAPTTGSYCAVARVGRWYSWQLGPTGAIKSDVAPANVCT